MKEAATRMLAAPGATCPTCGGQAERGQLVCLECGGRIALRYRRPPRWQLPVGIAALVVIVAVAGLLIALGSVNHDAKKEVASAPVKRQAAAPPAKPKKATPAPKPARAERKPVKPKRPARRKATPPRPGGVAGWPRGRDGFTVVLVSSGDRASARSIAAQAVKDGVPAGVLRSNSYSSLSPGFWIVYAGVHRTRERADKAAARLSRRFPGAYTQFVNGSKSRR